jgi:flagella basal body P-ring formation protein FlgA
MIMRKVRNQNAEFRRPVSAVSGQKNIVLMMLRLIMVPCFLFTGVASATPMEDVLKQYLKENYPWADVEIRDIVLSGEPSSQMPEKISLERGLQNRTVFALYYGNGRKITATATVKALDWIVMTTRAFRKGYVLQEEDVYATLMDISRIPKDAVKTTDEVIGTALTRSVIANRPIVAGMVSGTLRVKKGQRVAIVAESPNFSMVVKGELKETAYVGSDVKVLNIDSKKVVSGRLVSESTVKVVF